MDWISVEDRLPEDKGSFLVAVEFCCTGTEGRWIKYQEVLTFDGIFFADTYGDMTHWMPLPAPPED